MPAFRAVVFLLLALIPICAFGQDQDSSKFFDSAHQQIASIRKQLGGDVEYASFDAFRDGATAIATEADALIADRAPKLAALDARLAELGPAPPKGGPPEAADIAAQRSDIEKQHAALDAEIKRAKLLSVDSQQLLDDIAETRTSSFQARLSQHTPSPLTRAFWGVVTGNLVGDMARLNTLRIGIAAALADSFSADNLPYAIGGIIIALLLIVFGRWWVERALMRLTADRVPHGRLRRSALALAVVVVSTVFTGLAAQAIFVGLDWHDAFSDAEKLLAHSLVIVVFVSSFAAGLGRALLSASRPSWRLPPIPDAIASRLRLIPPLLGLAIGINIMIRRVNGAVGASIAATITATLISALVYCALIICVLLIIARTRATEPAQDGERPASPPARGSLWTGLVIAAFWIGCIVSLGAAVIGFGAFAQFVAQQMIWVAVVAGTFYLLVHLIEDFFSTLIASRAKWMEERLGVHQRTIEQLAVVLSGAFRLVAFLFALSLVMTRFGGTPTELLARGAQGGAGGFRIGAIAVTPGAVLGAIAVFLLGLLAIRILKNWLLDRYLPTTSLDPAMRSSVTTLLGYTGVVVVVAFALSELGLSVERIAWVASALSVGIGFGLQAVVQNFVSGLILLVERPVKVGDWVALGDVEGDIRRINVRATEIQMGDHSTMIVPNSELITKTVRNVTLANAPGRVMIRLPMPLDTDADAIIETMRAAFAANSRILDKPAMSVTLDGIQNATLMFVGVAFVDNPRQAGAVKSEILLDLLARLREASVRMVAPQEVAYRPLGAGPAMPDVGSAQ